MGGRGGGSAKTPSMVRNTHVQPPAPSLSPEAAVLDVYEKIKGPSGYAKIADLRDALPGLSDTQLTETVQRMADQRKIIIIPEENQQTLTSRDRASAVNYGGEAQHLFRIEH